jgi:hypothetical protein
LLLDVHGLDRHSFCNYNVIIMRWQDEHDDSFKSGEDR